MKRKTDDYEVGYGKPPRHSQFPPGVSGNKGRRRKTENSAEIVARVRDELVLVNGKHVTKFELAVQQTVNQTIRSGKTITGTHWSGNRFFALTEPRK